jgi:crotonobetainyl-CoA:carnitine CoA-transferase CaiB-like acyl-CoA transferase
LPPPALGEHTDQVLAELGYSPADVSALRERGAI